MVSDHSDDSNLSDNLIASGGVTVRIFLIFDNNSINSIATTLCLHT